MQQIWKDVKGYQGLYQVSNLGNVKSIKFRNHITVFYRQKILKHKIAKHKYKNRIYNQHQVSLSKNGISKYFLVHRLVWIAFNGEIPNNLQIDHINNNPQDNRLQNLQVLTKSENQKKKLNDNPNFKTNNKRILCLNDNVEYCSIKDASRKLQIEASNISAVCKGKRKHAGGYKFRYIDVFSIDERPNSALAVLINERN